MTKRRESCSAITSSMWIRKWRIWWRNFSVSVKHIAYESELTPAFGLSSNALKVIAMTSTVIDHCSLSDGARYPESRYKNKLTAESCFHLHKILDSVVSGEYQNYVQTRDISVRLCLRTSSLMIYNLSLKSKTIWSDEYCRQDSAQKKSIDWNCQWWMEEHCKDRTSRHRPFNNFIANSLSAIAVYCFFWKEARH